MNSTQQLIIKEAEKLLSEGGADLVIGFENGSLPFRTRPAFIREAKKSDKLVWNSFCSNNLAIYLTALYRKPVGKQKVETPLPTVALIAKGCDARSAIGLVQEKQVPRDKVRIIGVPCTGMADPLKIGRKLNGDRPTEWNERSDGVLEVTERSGRKTEIARDEVLFDACAECSHPVHASADVTIPGEAREPYRSGYRGVAEAESKSVQERWSRFAREFSKCIRCYACRQACPNCFCKTCFADQTKPRWISPGLDISDTMVFHIIRIFHQAGRCVECDACVRACPMDIDLKAFTRKLGKDVKELFDYVPGLSTEGLPPLCTYEYEDNQDFYHQAIKK